MLKTARLFQVNKCITTTTATMRSLRCNSIVSKRFLSSSSSLSSTLDKSTTGDTTTTTTTTSSSSNDSSLIRKLLHGSGESYAPAESHSKIVGAANKIYEMQVHNVKPDQCENYIKLTNENIPKLLTNPQFKGKLAGSWTTDVGDNEQTLYIYEYDSFADRSQTITDIEKDAAYSAYKSRLLNTLRSRSTNVLLRFQFWEFDPAPEKPGSIYELRTYRLHPGKLLEWEQRWRKGLECRRQFCQPVGAWFSHVGDLNYVYHMWSYADLEKRKQTREAAWQVDGWAQTVYNTVPLIQDMYCTILNPRSFSPLK